MTVFSTAIHRMLRSYHHHRHGGGGGGGETDDRDGFHHHGGRNCTNHTGTTTGGGFNETIHDDGDFMMNETTTTGLSFAGITSNEFEQYGYHDGDRDINHALKTFLVVFGTIAFVALTFLVAWKFFVAPLCWKKAGEGGSTSPPATHDRAGTGEAFQVVDAEKENDDNTADSNSLY